MIDPTSPPNAIDPRIFLVDGHAFLYRSFFAARHRPVRDAAGADVSGPAIAIQSFINLQRSHQPEYLAICLEGGHSGRDRMYPPYKATRSPMPPELHSSLSRLDPALHELGMAVFRRDGFEADDVIATAARKALGEQVEVVVVSPDKDFLQLVRPGANILVPAKSGPAETAASWVHAGNAADVLGVPPELVVDYLALVGDTSDNVPGVRGIGPKTAVQLLREFGSLDALLAGLDRVSSARTRTLLSEQSASAYLSRILLRMNDSVPGNFDARAASAPPLLVERMRRASVALGLPPGWLQ